MRRIVRHPEAAKTQPTVRSILFVRQREPVTAEVKARQLHSVGSKRTAAQLGVVRRKALDPRLAAFVDRLADLLVADLVRKPNDKG